MLQEAVEMSLADWYQIVMTPPGAKIEPSLLTRVAKASTSHNIDKAMLEGDLSLLAVETVMETRLLGAKALARLRQSGAVEVCSRSYPGWKDCRLMISGCGADQDVSRVPVRSSGLYGIKYHRRVVSIR